MRTGAAETSKGKWSGSLTNVDSGELAWWCEHDHSDDIEAEFCALDHLQNLQAQQAEFDIYEEDLEDDDEEEEDEEDEEDED